MKTGYLTLETHPEHRGLVRVLIKVELPNTQAASHGSKIRYIARFDNIEAGQMRLHNLLQHTLIDLDWVIATIEADDLRHNRVWIDPSLNDSEKQVIDTQTAKFRLRHKRWNTFWLMVGGFFVVLFLS
ncbi:MAG: hypothetical protein KZQ95_09495 [Candidatus Thiodiazotropha sp. (ex Epidulcina cf. delphinae)]|nr:hypothetical protein [Candidatus Thiodiazotropha sp. (ex Epidulcina cf. delphinae)]